MFIHFKRPLMEQQGAFIKWFTYIKKSDPPLWKHRTLYLVLGWFFILIKFFLLFQLFLMIINQTVSKTRE